MSSYKVSDIISEVRITMDMNSTDKKLLNIGAPETLSVDDVIKGHILSAVRDVETSAPTRMLGNGVAITESHPAMVPQGNLFKVSLKMPSDFLRLIKVKMSDWSRPVIEAVGDENPLYPVLQSECSGITGNPKSPVAAIVTGDDNQQILELYCCDTENATISSLRYLPMPRFENSEHTDAVRFDGIVDTDRIERAGFEGSFRAFYNKHSKRFVFTNDNDLLLRYYETCIGADRYNEIGSVKQDTVFVYDNKLYKYDAVSGELKKYADVYDEAVEIPNLLHKAVIYRTAYLSFLTLGDDAAAKRMADNLNEE